MHELTQTVHIDRPPDAVWPYLIDPDKMQLWINFESIQQLDEGPPAKGTRWRQTYRFLGKKMEMTDEAIEFEEGRRITLRPVEAPVDYTIDQRLEEVNGGTDFVCHFEIGDTHGFFGKLAEPLVVKMFERELRGQLERLQVLAEADAG